MIRKIAIYLLPFIVLAALLPEKARAQFEGRIVFRAFEPDRPEVPQRMLQFISTPQRIFISSDHRYQVFAGMDADGFLVRNDRDDFVFLSEDSDALVISRNDVDGLTKMIERMQGGGSQKEQFDWGDRLKETGEKKTVHGYETEKIEVYEEDTGNYVAIWLTDEIRINWGILEEAWHQSLAMLVHADIPVEVIMNRNSFPLEIEYYEDDRLATVVETSSIDRRSVEREEVEIPDGVTMLGMTDLMMRMMRNRN